jgi:adenylate kinase family enzyme
MAKDAILAAMNLNPCFNDENLDVHTALTPSKKDIKRVVVIGASGTGKSTLGRLLSASWDLPLCDLDDLSWLPGWIVRDRSEERADVEHVVAQEKWIVVGNYSRHRALTWPNAELIIWLDLPLHTCLWRGLRRALRHIWHRTPLCNGNYDSLGRLLRWDNRSIMHWIFTTHSERRVRYQRLLEDEKDETFPRHIRLRNQKEVMKFILSFSAHPIT